MRIEELLKKQTDKTKIIITDSVKNINRMIRKCNAEDLYKFNIKVMSFSQIAKECAAEKAAESNVIPQFLENIEYTAIIGRLLGSGSYGFIQKQNYCFDAYNEILKIINQIRMNRLKGKNEKISEINKLIAAYETELENNNEYDVCRMLHEVRKKYDNAEFALAFSRKLTLLEKRAAEILSGKSYDDIDKIDMYDKINYDNVDFVEVYGKANEVKAVVDDIAAKAPTLDNVTLYYTADEYENIIAAQFGAHNIPYRFETGVRGLSNDYIRLMYDILLFVKNGWEYKGLECAVLNPAAALGSLSGFDREISTGYGRDRYQKYTEMHDNKIQRFLGDLYALFDPACFKSTDVLFNAFLDLLNKKNAEGEQYTAFDKRVARVSFENTLKYMRIMPVDSFDSAIDVMLECLEKMRVIYKAPEGAYVSAVRYNGYNMAEKNFNYIVGLSSRQFLSQQIQSPLLSDIELEEYVENPELSRDKNLNKNNSLRQTLASNDKARFMLVYSTYDAAEQKIMSPASIYINLLAESGKKREDCVYRTSYNHFYGHVEADPRKIDLLLSETAQPAAYEPKRPEEFSASVINELLECSIKFYFEHIKGQPKLEYIRKNPDEWLNAMNKGTFYHKVLELYVENAIKTGKKEFDAQVFDDAFNTAIAESEQKNPTFSDKLREYFISEYREDLTKYVNVLHEHFAEGYVPEKCLTEEEIANFEMDISGSNGENYKLKIKKGFIDRVDFRTDGTAEIVDYKTGNIDNVEEKVKGNENCQHIIYPYALEKRGQKVDKFTYVSPAQPDKKVETNILFFESEPSDIIIRALLKNDFLPKDKRNCKYCSYKKYCPKEVIKNEYYR